MLLLKAYILLFLSANLIFISGFVFKKFFLKDAEKNILITGILGTFFLSIIALLINFIYPLSILINTITIAIILIFFFLTINKIIFKNILIYSSIVSLISFIIIIFDTVYRPDAGLYHLPFTKIINDHKIILGVNHLEFRYGHTSILQYLAAINNNYIFFDSGILFPLTFFFSIPVVFILEKIFNKNNKINKYLSFLFLFYIVYEMNRYGDFGNDTPAHILFFFTIIIFLRNDKNLTEICSNYKIVSTFSIFIFFIKSTLFFILLLPLYYILIEKKFYLIKLKYNIFLIFIIFLWSFKNFLISSCLIYPLSFTCSSDVFWSSYHTYTQAHPDFVSKLTEAWSKDIPNNTKNIGIDDYIKNFNWVSTWLTNHFIKIAERLSPLLIIFLILIIFKSRYFSKRDFDTNKSKIKFLLILNILGSVYWFLKFPTFRYGKSYIVCTLIFAFILLINFIYKKVKIEKSLFKIVLVSCLIIILAKNVKRIYLNYNNEYTNYPFPEIFIINNDGKIENHIPVSRDNKIVFYKTINSNLCMYGESPCSCCIANVDKIRLHEMYSYKVFSIK
jgi:hypothetical protein